MGTHPQWERRAPEVARRFFVRASPRGAQALVLGAKVRALPGAVQRQHDDIKAWRRRRSAIGHLNFEGEAEGVDTDTLIGKVVEDVEATAVRAASPFSLARRI